tara:strand:+ start:23464 stop:23886 length:423 start_codon:yes stop_codon:yes gene_type:complete
MFNPPYTIATRAAFALIAVAGTILFAIVSGAGQESGIKLAWITGISWIIFGTCLVRWSRLPFWHCIDFCLAAMVIGEIILILSALLALPGPGIVAANLAMAAFLADRFLKRGFPVWKTCTLWFAVLNGIALILTPFFYEL